MIPFSTEFPISSGRTNAEFIAEVIAWLNGTNYSTVLTEHAERDLEKEHSLLRTTSGEELCFRAPLSDGNSSAIGFRHDNPDNTGRVWRTEAVLRRRSAEDSADIIRLRTQCIAQKTDARIETPRKPYLIKSMIQSGWGGVDGTLPVSDQPIWLPETEEGLNSAVFAARGQISKHLPVIYLSIGENRKWLLSKDQINKLAYDLGGIAHILVEPSKAFSIELKERLDGSNVYGGTIGLSLPNRGTVRRFYLGWRLKDATEVANAIRYYAQFARSQMPTVGWDWAELQEQALRLQRQREKNRLSQKELEELYETEIQGLKEKITELKNIIDSSSGFGATRPSTDTSNLGDISNFLGPELYDGEFFDRLRLAASTTLNVRDQIGLDPRSTVLFERFISNLQPSKGLEQLRRDLKHATSDAKKSNATIPTTLYQYGYRKKSDNKHIVLKPLEKLEGLDAITLSKTPSDNKSMQNIRKQIERSLGITKL